MNQTALLNTNLVVSACALMAAMTISTGCDKEKEKPAPKVKDEVIPPPKVEKQAREVFGVPLPPRVRSMSKNAHYVWVETDMSIKALHKFYLKALKGSDFEVIRIRNSLRIVGLKPMMAFVQAAYIRGARSNIRMVFSPSRPITSAQTKRTITTKLSDGTTKKRVTIVPRKRKPLPKAGSVVDIRLPNGKLLAPGAKWGEPYTPPKGSPLDTRSMKPNFGKPFGEWQGQ